MKNHTSVKISSTEDSENIQIFADLNGVEVLLLKLDIESNTLTNGYFYFDAELKLFDPSDTRKECAEKNMINPISPSPSEFRRYKYDQHAESKVPSIYYNALQGWKRFIDLKQETNSCLDWVRAEENLKLFMDEYSSLPNHTGQLALQVTMVPLLNRFNSGERTRELYDAMIGVS